jgi:F-type H+-transporting ATPase subunit epsilon
MHLEIITPDKTVFTGEVGLIQLPGIEGKIKIKKKDKNLHYFEINGGIIEVLKNKVLILAE